MQSGVLLSLDAVRQYSHQWIDHALGYLRTHSLNRLGVIVLIKATERLLQLGDISKQMFAPYLIDGVPLSESFTKTDWPSIVPSGGYVSKAIWYLAFKHFGFPVGYSANQLVQLALDHCRSYFRVDCKEEEVAGQRMNWIDRAFYGFLASTLAQSEPDAHFVANVMNPNSPLQFSDVADHLLMLKIMLNDFRRDNRFDETLLVDEIRSGKSKVVIQTLDTYIMLQNDDKSNFSKAVSHLLKAHGKRIRNKIARTDNPRKNSVDMVEVIALFPSVLWNLAVWKWGSLPEIPVTDSAFLLTRDSIGFVE